jgi:hypothetical protein
MSDEFRQAVVVIHGIGDQRPMDTLRTFVGSVLKTDQYFGKPDRISDSLELYRLSVPAQGNIPSTDFYELYWAHLMEGTTWEHVTAWVRVLLLRRPSLVPERLRSYWLGMWVAAIVAFVITVTLAESPERFVSLGIVGVAGLWLLRAVVGSIGLHYIGDAARYLSPTPRNIGVRHAIRNAALELLRGLHDNPHHPTQHYNRIVVVGHSLGSVIAYDALRYLWQEVHSYPGEKPAPSAGGRELPPDLWPNETPSVVDIAQPTLTQLRELIREGTGSTPDEYQRAQRDVWAQHDYRALQRELWGEQRRLGIRWKITDLVTLGSPLTHAEFLMADGAEDLKRRHRDREYPTCPPQPEDVRDDGLLVKPVTFGNRKVEVAVLHHAALFACTRWTNLYYPGDIVGGRVAPQFGAQITDRALSGANGVSSHVHYWKDAGVGALQALRDALALDEVPVEVTKL